MASMPAASAAAGGAFAAAAIAEGAAAVLAGFGLAYCQCTAGVLLAVERGRGRLGLDFVFHFYEAKTLALAGVAIVDDLRLFTTPCAANNCCKSELLVW